jgi:hypothetical protein
MVGYLFHLQVRNGAKLKEEESAWKKSDTRDPARTALSMFWIPITRKVGDATIGIFF